MAKNVIQARMFEVQRERSRCSHLLTETSNCCIACSSELSSPSSNKFWQRKIYLMISAAEFFYERIYHFLWPNCQGVKRSISWWNGRKCPIKPFCISLNNQREHISRCIYTFCYAIGFSMTKSCRWKTRHLSQVTKGKLCTCIERSIMTVYRKLHNDIFILNIYLCQYLMYKIRVDKKSHLNNISAIIIRFSPSLCAKNMLISLLLPEHLSLLLQN